MCDANLLCVKINQLCIQEDVCQNVTSDVIQMMMVIVVMMVYDDDDDDDHDDDYDDIGTADG